jgi:3-deoxy-manno-octulosonate cytidylyltransferase (CMP-KDO synthetase)
MRTIAVIPARYRSSRLPGKPLADIHGKPMVQRVYERVSMASLVDGVLVATDDERIRDAVADFGGNVVMTSPEHASGSDRIAEAVFDVKCDLVVNVQGDEPLVAPDAIDDAVRTAAGTGDVIVTLRSEIADRGTLFDPNVVKVVTDLDGFALYFSRSPIPWPGPSTDEGAVISPGTYFKHVGLYVYPKDQLISLSRTPPSLLESRERLEQLRALSHGIRIRVRDTAHELVAVDTEADLDRVREIVGASEASTMNHGP